MKKHLLIILLISVILLTGCMQVAEPYDIVATTLPVYEFTTLLCEGTGLTVGRLVTESVSCLHDYSLQVSQMRMLESAQVIVISGVGLEDFLADALASTENIVDASVNAHIHAESHHHNHDDDHGHNHAHDPHIWLSTENASAMVTAIFDGLTLQYPEHTDTFRKNLDTTLCKLQELQDYGMSQLTDIRCRELITFHDGFAYFAEGFDLTILKAVEEESGSEASASEIIELVQLVKTHQLPAIFTEVSGSTACAEIIQFETGVSVYNLDMAMSGDSYFDAMYRNIDTIKEALK